MALKLKFNDPGEMDKSNERTAENGTGFHMYSGVESTPKTGGLTITANPNQSGLNAQKGLNAYVGMNSQGMALPSVPKDQIGPRQMQYQNGGSVSLTPSDNVSTTAPAQLPSTVPTATGQNTSDGQPISSAYGTASDFYAQISMNDIVDNTPSGAMTYAGYLAYNGITDPRVEYAQQLDAANEQYARALGTYGYAGEGLAQGNLANSGYSEYLNGVAYTQKAGAYRQALTDYQQKVNQYGQQYARYKNDLANTNTQNAAKVYTYLAELGITSESDLYNASQALLAQGYSQADIDAGINNWRDRNAVSGGSEDGTSILTSTQTEIYNYLAENLSNASQLEAMKYQLKSNGYSDADIDAAIKNWETTNSASAIGKIGEITSLAVGNAQALKQQYGSGTAYDNALKALQEKNQELLDKFFSEDTDWSDPEYYDFLSTFESEDGTNSFDDLSASEKVIAFSNYVAKMYSSGDITKDQYREFNYKSLNASIDDVYNSTDNKETKIKNIFENLARAYSNEGSLSDQGYQEIYNKLNEIIQVSERDNGAKSTIHYYDYNSNQWKTKESSTVSAIHYYDGKQWRTIDYRNLMKDILKTNEQRDAFSKYVEDREKQAVDLPDDGNGIGKAMVYSNPITGAAAAIDAVNEKLPDKGNGLKNAVKYSDPVLGAATAVEEVKKKMRNK